MQHVCAAKVPQWLIPHNRPLPLQRGAEVSLTGGRGDKVGGRNCAQHLWDPPLPHLLLQVPWESHVGDRRILSRGSTQPQEGEVEVVAADKGVGERGSVLPDFGNVLFGSCAGSLILLVVDVGYVPTHWEELGRLPPQGGPQTDSTASV